MDALFNSCVLGGKAKRVPAHRMEDVVAAHRLETGDDIADRIDPDMPHVDAARRIRKHLQAIVFGKRAVLSNAKDTLRGPTLLPFGFDRAVFVGTIHTIANLTY